MVKNIFFLLQFFLIVFCCKGQQHSNKTLRSIVWDSTTLRRVSAANTNIKYNGYGRIRQLKNGMLIAIYESSGSIVVVYSNDLGNSWSPPQTVAPKQSRINMTVPDILELSDGSLLSCYNGRPISLSATDKFDIRIKQSFDMGKTWTEEKILYQAGHKFEDGCWEPSAIQLPNGEIQIYFSNEGIYRNTNEQNISMIRSTNMGRTWSQQPQIVSFRTRKRDGMPVPLLLKNRREIVVAIEDNAFGSFKPYIVRSSVKDNWNKTVIENDANRSHALKDTLPSIVYAGAPYIVQLKTGETILSYQSNEDRLYSTKFTNMKVLVGDEDARNFGNKTTPFNIPLDKACKWNSLTVLNDDTIIAVTSTNAYTSNQVEVWMIKGRLVNIN